MCVHVCVHMLSDILPQVPATLFLVSLIGLDLANEAKLAG